MKRSYKICVFVILISIILVLMGAITYLLYRQTVRSQLDVVDRQRPAACGRFAFDILKNKTLLNQEDKNRRNETRYPAASNFWPINALQVYQCFDGLNMNMSASLVRDQGQIAHMPTQEDKRSYFAKQHFPTLSTPILSPLTFASRTLSTPTLSPLTRSTASLYRISRTLSTLSPPTRSTASPYKISRTLSTLSPLTRSTALLYSVSRTLSTPTLSPLTRSTALLYSISRTLSTSTLSPPTRSIASFYNISRNEHWLKNHGHSVRNWLPNNAYKAWRDIRLPRHVQPTIYDLLLRPNIHRATFSGKQTIHITITMATDHLLLHERGLKIHSLQFVSENECKRVSIVEEFSYRRNEYHVIMFEKEIPAGKYRLTMEFEGYFGKNQRGIHRYQYQHRETGDIRYLLATRFKSTYARRVFPCFDEPSFKAKFKLSIVHPRHMTAVSNMPQEKRENLAGGLIKTVFMESEMMSTYLLFYAISDFGYLEADYGGKPVRAYVRPDRLEEAFYGLNLTLKLLHSLEIFFDTPYMLPKLDIVAIPGYSVPSKEHWGVMTFDEDRFLITGSLSERIRLGFVDRFIASEVVHQWIGNLVTMKWWDDLWLYEGLSTIIAYTTLKEYFPSVTEVEVRTSLNFMCSDSNVDSHPIFRKAITPDEIDALSFEKGADVLRMLQDVMQEDFRRGLVKYLKKYSYGNADEKDLWAEMDNASSIDVDVAPFMDTWTKQVGFPYVELTRNGSNLTATQAWFSRNDNESRAEEVTLQQKLIWRIPLTYINLVNGSKKTLWLHNTTAVFDMEYPEDVFKFNAGSIRPYIVQYDISDWERLGRMLLDNHEAVDVADRYNLLHDAFLLAEMDRLPYSIALSLTRYLRKEKNALPWNLFRDNILHFEYRLGVESPALQLLMKYVSKLTSELYNEFVASANNKSMFKKWHSGDYSCSYTYRDPKLEFILIDLACRSSNEKCLEEMHYDLQRWLHGQRVTSDMLLMLKVAIAHFGNDLIFRNLWEQLTIHEKEWGRKRQLAMAIGSFVDARIVNKTLDLLASEPRIGLQIAKLMLQKMSDTKPHSAWHYIADHWDVIINRFNAQNNPSIVTSLFCGKLRTTEDLEMMKYITTMYDSPTRERGVRKRRRSWIQNCMTESEKAVEWSKKHEADLMQWLRGNV